MFIQSQAFFGSDVGIHALLMKHFDRSKVSVFCACNKDENGIPDKTSLPHIQSIPNVTVRPTDFGASMFGKSRKHRIQKGLGRAPNVAVSLLSLVKYIRENKIDIIHGTEKPRDAFYGTVISRLSGAKMVVHLHVKYESWISPKVQWATKNADAVIGVSEYIRQTIIDGGVDAKKVHAVVNCFDFTGTKWDKQYDPMLIRGEFGVGKDDPLVGILARICIWKGHGDLVEAYALARKQVPNMKLLIAGTDDPRAHPGGGSYTAELKELATKLGVSDGIIWTGFRTDTPQIVSALDVYAMPTFEEPCAVAFLEAMAMRKPILAYLSGGTAEMVTPDVCGVLSPVKDIKTLADGLVKMANDPTLRKRMGDAGRARVENVLTPQSMAANVVKVYEAALGR
jgi:glycosyltransferase involved in cell wall biosynthesis